MFGKLFERKNKEKNHINNNVNNNVSGEKTIFLKNKKRLYGLIPIAFVLMAIAASPNIKVLYSRCPCNKIKNKKIRQFILNNKTKALDSCLPKAGNFEYYNSIYRQIINTTENLERNKYINGKHKHKIFSLLKKGRLYELREKINTITLSVVNTDSISKKLFLTAMVNDLLFNENEAERLYLKAIENNKFDSKYYMYLAKFYQKSCNPNEAINVLLKVSSVLNNNNDRNDIDKFYLFLGDLYYGVKDYNNAMVYYTNSLINIDTKNKDHDKFGVIMKIGDIMSIRGNNFEAINHYKYALSLKNRKVSPENNIILLLKLSNVYYKYGNYVNGLKFAKSASQKAKLIADNELLYSKAKYLECLNYEYLKETVKAKKACDVALKLSEKYIAKNSNDVNGYVNIAELLDFSYFIKNPKLAKMYLNKALSLTGRNIFTRLSIMEKIASIDSYSSEFTKVPEQYKKIHNMYRKMDMKPDCCSFILNAFVKERMGISTTEYEYLKAEVELKDRYSQLFTLYCYMSDNYKRQGNLESALKYAKKAVDVGNYIYRYDHHYIKYATDKVEALNEIINKK